MYAIVETGGKQYRVEEGDEIDVELLGPTQIGSTQVGPAQEVVFEKVLLLSDGQNPKVGVPYIPECFVHAHVLGEVKGPKVIAFKYKKRKNYRRTVGHRQRYMRVKITKIAVA